MVDKTVYIVSRDPAIRDSLTELIASTGLSTEAFPTLEMWLEAVRSKPCGCLVLDAEVRNFTDPERLARMLMVCRMLPALLLVDRGELPFAMPRVKQGALEILEKPLRDTDLLEHIKMAAGED